MYITRITLCHVLFNPSSSSCSYSLLHPSSLGPRLPLHLRVRAPGSDSFSRAPAPNVLPLSSPGSKCPSSLEPRLQVSFLSRAPAPSVLPLSSPGSKCPSSLEPRLRLLQKPTLRFPLLRIFVFFRELNIHHSNSISIYNKTVYHQTK